MVSDACHNHAEDDPERRPRTIQTTTAVRSLGSENWRMVLVLLDFLGLDFQDVSPPKTRSV
jgi:hypothetical protein